ncbi:MAG TPA: glycoside hydrolase family 16 protein [Actinopolymorphaceae bacterium]|jgi:beta-glucanase (GH16 family)
MSPRKALAAGAIVSCVALLAGGVGVMMTGGDRDRSNSRSDESTPQWTLTWSDDFDGPAGRPPDRARWVAEIGGHGWGNDELQYYTDLTENAALDGNGHLVITARPDDVGRSCWYGTCRFTSARLVTKQKFSQAYGRFEARIKLPRGQGVWPAFWLLGDDIDEVGWPRCGEIDIMEYLGHDERTVYGSVHGPQFDTTDEYRLPDGESFAEGFHTFTVDWSANRVDFFVDGQQYATVERPDAATSGGSERVTNAANQADGDPRWVFDHPFFILLNVAVGGRWPGEPDESTRFPQHMVVDYVRVYQLT